MEFLFLVFFGFFCFFNKLTVVVEKPPLSNYFRMGLAISLVAKEKEKVSYTQEQNRMGAIYLSSVHCWCEL